MQTRTTPANKDFKVFTAPLMISQLPRSLQSFHGPEELRQNKTRRDERETLRLCAAGSNATMTDNTSSQLPVLHVPWLSRAGTYVTAGPHDRLSNSSPFLHPSPCLPEWGTVPWWVIFMPWRPCNGVFVSFRNLFRPHSPPPATGTFIPRRRNLLPCVGYGRLRDALSRCLRTVESRDALLCACRWGIPGKMPIYL